MKITILYYYSHILAFSLKLPEDDITSSAAITARLETRDGGRPLKERKLLSKADFNRERLLPILCIEMVLRSKYLNNKFLISGPIVNSVGGGEETHTLKKVRCRYC